MNKAQTASPTTVFRTRAESRALRQGAWGKFFVGLTLLYFYQDVLSGLSRYLFSAAGVPILNYLPSIAVTITATFYILDKSVRQQSPRCLVIALAIALSYLYSLAAGRPLFIASFAFYTWGAFLLGVVALDQNCIKAILKHAPMLWLIAVAGVLLNSAVAFPWSGIQYEILGQQVDAARSWNTYGADRLPGFSRGSFAAANQIAVCLLVIVAVNWKVRWQKTLKVGVWILSLVAITLTTSKTPLITAAAGPILMFIFSSLQNARILQRTPLLVYTVASLAVLELIVILPPFVLSVMNVGNTYVNLPEALAFFRLDSFVDRISYTWPAAFSLLSSGDNAGMMQIFGRGIGGIGGAQNLSEVYLFNAGDNLFVFLYVTFGILCSLFFGTILIGWSSRLATDGEDARLLYALAVSVLFLGVLTSVLESVIPAFASGAVVAKAIFPSTGASTRKIGKSV